ncbi:MAG: hypothetical protein ABWY08_11445 [Comamonas sp.]
MKFTVALSASARTCTDPWMDAPSASKEMLAEPLAEPTLERVSERAVGAVADVVTRCSLPLEGIAFSPLSG